MSVDALWYEQSEVDSDSLMIDVHAYMALKLHGIWKRTHTLQERTTGGLRRLRRVYRRTREFICQHAVFFRNQGSEHLVILPEEARRAMVSCMGGGCVRF